MAESGMAVVQSIAQNESKSCGFKSHLGQFTIWCCFALSFCKHLCVSRLCIRVAMHDRALQDMLRRQHKKDKATCLKQSFFKETLAASGGIQIHVTCIAGNTHSHTVYGSLCDIHILST